MSPALKFEASHTGRAVKAVQEALRVAESIMPTSPHGLMMLEDVKAQLRCAFVAIQEAHELTTAEVASLRGAYPSTCPDCGADPETAAWHLAVCWRELGLCPFCGFESSPGSLHALARAALYRLGRELSAAHQEVAKERRLRLEAQRVVRIMRIHEIDQTESIPEPRQALLPGIDDAHEEEG
jgi:hypothetical protein